MLLESARFSLRLRDYADALDKTEAAAKLLSGLVAEQNPAPPKPSHLQEEEAEETPLRPSKLDPL